jgi:hypothetical protein
MARKQITLLPGNNTILHGLDGFTDPALVMVIPAVPVADWLNIDIVGQPTLTSVVLFNSSSGSVTLNVVFEYPHSVLGAAVLDNYA